MTPSAKLQLFACTKDRMREKAKMFAKDDIRYVQAYCAFMG